MATIVEYRGIEGLVYAEVTEDTDGNYTTGEVKSLAGVQELTKTTETSSETHFYDNIPAVIITGQGSDEVSMNTSAIPLHTLADITSQYYDEATGMLVEGDRENKYYALGYRTQMTDNSEVLVWRLKGQFNTPDSTHATKDDGTDANGQELVYTGISTTHKFTKNGKPARGIVVKAENVDASTFFDTVMTPDSVKAKTV